MSSIKNQVLNFVFLESEIVILYSRYSCLRVSNMNIDGFRGKMHEQNIFYIFLFKILRNIFHLLNDCGRDKLAVMNTSHKWKFQACS